MEGNCPTNPNERKEMQTNLTLQGQIAKADRMNRMTGAEYVVLRLTDGGFLACRVNSWKELWSNIAPVYSTNENRK